MSGFIYRCPVTGLNVQGWLSSERPSGNEWSIGRDPSGPDDNTFETVVCPVCARIHLVNPKTGKTLGADER